MKRNVFKLFINKFLEYPLWIKQAVYYEISQDMKRNNCENYIIGHAGEIFALYKPILTYQGQNILQSKEPVLDSNIYNFLKFVHSGYSILEIALNMFLSMEEISKLFVFCINQEFLEKPKSNEILSLSGFIAGKFLTGEYFLNNGTITREQLELAINEYQKDIKKGKKKFFGEILTECGFVPKETIKLLFAIKSDAAKRFVMNPENLPNSKQELSEIDKLKNELKSLKDENLALKKTMGKIVNAVKNYDI